jgi:alpha-galactosidase/6-phospho-beta-glucosidase family protein
LAINLTNPSGIVVAAAQRQAGLRPISMCDSPVTLAEQIAVRLGIGVGRVRERTYGMNHAGWWVPASPDELEACLDLAAGQDPEAVRALGVVGGPYLRYYLHPDRILAQQRVAGTVRAQQLQALERSMLEGYAEGAGDLPKRGAVWYGKAVLPLIDAWLNGADEPLTVGLRNDDRIPGLPPEVMTEGPVAFPAPGRMQPLPVPPSPPAAATLLAAHAAYEQAAAEAIVGGAARAALVRALALNPMVGSSDTAAALVDEILARSPR